MYIMQELRLQKTLAVLLKKWQNKTRDESDTAEAWQNVNVVSYRSVDPWGGTFFQMAGIIKSSSLKVINQGNG